MVGMWKRTDEHVPRREPGRASRGGAAEPELLRLQRLVGNTAVGQLLAPVQRTRVDVMKADRTGVEEVPGTVSEDSRAFRYGLLGLPQQRIDDIVAAFQAQQPAPGSWNADRLAELLANGASVVIAGHGRFSDDDTKKLADQPPGAKRDRRQPEDRREFLVPPGKVVVFYGPHGATLDNPVASAVERGQVPDVGTLQLVNENYKETPFPAGYPYTFRTGQKVPDYTVTPDSGNKLNIDAKSFTVGKPRLLSSIVKNEPQKTFHFACCAASDVTDTTTFPYKGYFVRFR